MTTKPGERAGPDGRSGRDRRLDWLLASGIGARALHGVAMLPLIPLLIGPDPLLLTLLSGSAVAEVVVGARVRLGEISWPVAVLAGLPAWVLFDWLYWAAGRRWGGQALAMLTRHGGARRARQLDRAHLIIHRFGPVGIVLVKFLPVPSPLVFAAAGTAGMRLPTFVALNLVGTTLGVVAALTLGFTLGQQAVDLVELFQQYAVVTTLVLVGVLVAFQVVRRRRDSTVPDAAGPG